MPTSVKERRRQENETPVVRRAHPCRERKEGNRHTARPSHGPTPECRKFGCSNPKQTPGRRVVPEANHRIALSDHSPASETRQENRRKECLLSTPPPRPSQVRVAVRRASALLRTPEIPPRIAGADLLQRPRRACRSGSYALGGRQIPWRAQRRIAQAPARRARIGAWVDPSSRHHPRTDTPLEASRLDCATQPWRSVCGWIF